MSYMLNENLESILTISLAICIDILINEYSVSCRLNNNDVLWENNKFKLYSMSFKKN